MRLSSHTMTQLYIGIYSRRILKAWKCSVMKNKLPLKRNTVYDTKKGNLIGSLNVVLVIRLGFEPKTPTLKVLCSTD